jgi:hypothetical protein
MQRNAFDTVLDLEEEFYNAGFHQGSVDGIKAGRIEGRTFGLEKGFEKYVESGRLYGKSIIWSNQIQKSRISESQKTVKNISISPSTLNAPSQNSSSLRSLPPLPMNHRLLKHIKTLHALSESESLSIENTEEAVTDFDDRTKRAQGKAKVIERIVRGFKDGSVGNQDAISGDLDL